MEENSSGGENTNPGYVPPSHVPPLFQANSSFYHVENTYPSAFPELHQENQQPFNVNYPQILSEINEESIIPFTVTYPPILPETQQECYTPFSVTYPQPKRNQESYTPVNVTYPPILHDTHQENCTNPFSITYPSSIDTHQENCTPFSITYPPILSETQQENYSPFSITYPPILPEKHQGSFTSINVNQNSNPTNVLERTGLPFAPSHPTNYLLDTILDTSAIINRADFEASSKNSISQSSGSRDPHKVTFQCKKCHAEFHSSHAFGGHMSHHAKLAKKFENPQTMMATLDKLKHAESISAKNEGFSESGLLPQKKRGRKKGKVVVADEPKVKKHA